MTSGGTWTYTLDDTNAAVQALNTGGMLTDTFTVQTADGTAQQVSVTIHGANDAATISGTTSGSVIEAGAGNGGGTPTATGTLHDTDVDNTPNSFQAVASGASDHGYGTFSILQNGKWTYTLDNANADVNALNTGDTLNDTFTVHTQDGTAQQVSITINGTTDDQGGPTGISFALNGNASPSLNNLGTFTATGDPDGANDSFTWSAAGSSAGISIKPDGTLDASGAAAGDNVLNVQVTDQAGNAFLQAYHVWVGTGANDTFSFALSGSVIADGLNGTDTITGGSGIDHLLGGNGADKLTGGGGADQLAGQGGADTFAYLAVSDSTPAAHDTILDFTAGGGNHDVISFLNALGLTAFDGQIAGSTLAGGHVGWKEAGGETVVYANTSGASETLGATNMEIHLSGTGLGLGTNDFLLHA
jgi:VCBS repeat-containing protein